MATARDLCLSALQKCGAFSDVTPVDERDIVLALNTLNEVINFLNLQATFPPYDYLITGQIVPNQVVYTIGATGDFVTPRVPNVVKGLQWQNGNVWFGVDQVNFEDLIAYANIDNIQFNPTKFCYQRIDDDTGEIRIFPQISQPQNVRIVATIVNPTYLLDDIVSLPSAYEGALIWETARMLCIEYGNYTKLPVAEQESAKRIRLLKQTAHTQNIARNDWTSRGSVWDIRGDGYRGGFNAY